MHEVERETESCKNNIEENLANEIEEESEELKEMKIIENKNVSDGNNKEEKKLQKMRTGRIKTTTPRQKKSVMKKRK